MADFMAALPTIFLHEGGLSDHPSDPGGITNFGVSLKFALGEKNITLFDIDHDGDVDADDIRKMTKDDASRVYRECWWDRYGYSRIDRQDVATKVFDMSVNMGSSQAHKIVQRACNRLASTPLDPDGKLGPISIKTINSLGNMPLIDAIRSIQEQFYRDLVQQKPVLAVFLKGWINRARS